MNYALINTSEIRPG